MSDALGGWTEWSVQVDYQAVDDRLLFDSREEAEEWMADKAADDPDAVLCLLSRFVSGWTRHE